MTLSTRYTIGFKRAETRSIATDRNPGWFPIIDNESIGALGVVVALCDDQKIAERIANLLNAGENPARL